MLAVQSSVSLALAFSAYARVPNVIITISKPFLSMNNSFDTSAKLKWIFCTSGWLVVCFFAVVVVVSKRC